MVEDGARRLFTRRLVAGTLWRPCFLGQATGLDATLGCENALLTRKRCCLETICRLGILSRSAAIWSWRADDPEGQARRASSAIAAVLSAALFFAAYRGILRAKKMGAASQTGSVDLNRVPLKAPKVTVLRDRHRASNI